SVGGLSVADRQDIAREEDDDDLAAARWVLAIDEGLGAGEAEAFHAWIEARPERAELIARQAALVNLAGRRTIQEQAPHPRRRALLTGGIAAAAAGVALTGAALWKDAPWAGKTETYTTANGEIRTIDLADSSRLWIDARTHASVRLSSA